MRAIPGALVGGKDSTYSMGCSETTTGVLSGGSQAGNGGLFCKAFYSNHKTACNLSAFYYDQGLAILNNVSDKILLPEKTLCQISKQLV